MPQCFNNISSASLPLCLDHGSTVSYTHQCLPQIAATTHKGYPVVVLVDVMCINSWGSDFTLINVVHTNGLQDLSLSN
jgi:hypothetical protein